MRPSRSAVAIVASCAALIASSAFAGAGKKSEKVQLRGEAQFASLRTAIGQVDGLTSEQKSKADAIVDDAVAQAAALREDRKAAKTDATAAGDASSSRRAMRQKAVQLQAKTTDSVASLLSEPQRTSFQQAMREAEATPHGKAARSARRAAPTTAPAN